MVEFYVDIIGYIGAFFISMMFVPQVYHIYKNKQVANNFFIILDNLYDLLWSTSRP